MWGFVLLLAFEAAGMGLSRIGVPLPAGVTGLILLAAALYSGRVPLPTLLPAARPLLRHLQLLFLPLIVGAWSLRSLWGRYPLALLFVLVAATVVSLVVAALVAAWCMSRQDAARRAAS